MTVNPIIDTDKLADDAKVGSDLNRAFMDQASIFVHYATLHRDALVQYGKKKIAVDTLYSRLYKEAREKAEADGKKITEATIDAEINRNRDYLAARLELVTAEGIESLTRNTLEAFKQRKDMLVQLGADARQEAAGDLRMSAATAAIESYKREH